MQDNTNLGEGPSSPLNSASAKARLTEEQKKRNHIESEKKRREAIRNGFDRLSTIVPGMQGQARSEAIVLAATVDHMRALLQQKEQIQAAATAKGWSLEQINRYYQGAEQEARANENAPLEYNAAKIPIGIQAVPLQQQQQQSQTPINAFQAPFGARPTPTSTGTPMDLTGPVSATSNGYLPATENGEGAMNSQSDSPPSSRPAGD
ncbi:Putative myc-type, basic helix-loop-helix (bHLH) domain-containing protein [Septoria linicola]|uniref:Myc-type, basic helix-loop-helix (BHLH) domain-containing protein n=1 Tax=Septoria linicola TaxID=215465 RepID=A0A9Q9ARE4_9PEZI|nr:Putative myc-type, basic helix-loop-helix (bHLH) domain-containing protein [Septoria linicola]